MNARREASRSQSPYGAKWFATNLVPSRSGPDFRRRNPLTGLSGLQLCSACREDCYQYDSGRNPLTGLSGLQLKKGVRSRLTLMWSQSPYGAKWFATRSSPRGAVARCIGVAIPLRG